MKKQFLFALLLSFAVHICHAQTMASVVSKVWTGTGEMTASYTKTGKMYFTSTYDLSVNSSDRVSGTYTTKMVLDGVSYSLTTTVSGSVDGSVHQVDLQEGGIIRSDDLPNGMRWCTGGMGTLTLYNDGGNAGYYLLKGNMRDACGNTIYTELSDK